MKQLVSQKGEILLVDKDSPTLSPTDVLIETIFSAVSSGTEKLIHGLHSDEPRALGYSAAGIVRQAGSQVADFKPGDFVAAYGAPYVKHAEWLAVPHTLVAKVKDVSVLELAAFAGVGAIAIHALRQAELKFGETVVIIGLGILGQIIAQIAVNAGYDVIGYDLSSSRCQRLERYGQADVGETSEQVLALLDERGIGADAVLICAGGKATGLIDEALNWVRDRGKIVIVGDVKGDFDRNLLFKKEAQIVISRAGGPGRYDKSYEAHSVDYPLGYVRWTEGRNVGEFIRLLEKGRLDMESLITHRLAFREAESVYEKTLLDADALGIVMDFKNNGT